MKGTDLFCARCTLERKTDRSRLKIFGEGETVFVQNETAILQKHSAVKNQCDAVSSTVTPFGSFFQERTKSFPRGTRKKTPEKRRQAVKIKGNPAL